MKALLAALLSYGGSEILGAIVQRIFGGKSKIGDTINEVAPDIKENLPSATERFFSRLGSAWEKRMGKKPSDDELEAIKDALK